MSCGRNWPELHEKIQKRGDNSPTGNGRVTVLARDTPYYWGTYVYVQLFEYRRMHGKVTEGNLPQADRQTDRQTDRQGNTYMPPVTD